MIFTDWLGGKYKDIERLSSIMLDIIYHIPAIHHIISSKFILDKDGESLVQPQVVPPSRCNQVAEPLKIKAICWKRLNS